MEPPILKVKGSRAMTRTSDKEMMVTRLTKLLSLLSIQFKSAEETDTGEVLQWLGPGLKDSQNDCLN